MNKNESSYYIKSVGKALKVIEKVVNSDQPLGLTELSQKLSLNRSTVYRLLKTLQDEFYLEQISEENRKYVVGTKLIGLSSCIIENLDLKKAAKPYLEKLQEKTDETVHLALIGESEKDVVYIDKVDSGRTIKMSSAIGKRVPMHSTSLGKIMLAYMKDSKKGEILDKIELKGFTSKTITSKEKLLEHLKEVRNKGYAIDDEENDENVRCIAAPIFDNEGDIAGAISLSGPSLRLTLDNLEEISGLILEYSRKISESIGYNGQL